MESSEDEEESQRLDRRPETKRHLLDLDELTVGELIQIETELAELLPRSTPKSKPGITAETLKAITKGEKP